MWPTKEEFTVLQRHRSWNEYLLARSGDFQFRCKRFSLVYEKMQQMGSSHPDAVVDVGAGRGEFGLFLKMKHPHSATEYIAVDGSINGVDLEGYYPHLVVDFYVCIEVLEHLQDPHRLLKFMRDRARVAVIITTPNPHCTDVLGMDKTHVTPLSEEVLMGWGMSVSPQVLFTEDKRDTLLAWCKGRAK